MQSLLVPFMTVHGHGTSPSSFIAGAGTTTGEYTFTDLNFIMAGEWDLTFSVSQDNNDAGTTTTDEIELTLVVANHSKGRLANRRERTKNIIVSLFFCGRIACPAAPEGEDPAPVKTLTLEEHDPKAVKHVISNTTKSGQRACMLTPLKTLSS